MTKATTKTERPPYVSTAQPKSTASTAASSSNTMARDFLARSEAVTTFMPGAGTRTQEAARTRLRARVATSVLPVPRNSDQSIIPRPSRRLPSM